jgi:hypothetical protein
MKPRTQVIILLILLAVLGVVALVVLTGNRGGEGASPAAAAATASPAAGTSAAPSSGAAPGQGASVVAFSRELNDIAAWLAAKDLPSLLHGSSRSEVLGLSRVAAPVQTGGEPGPAGAQRSETLRLDGILWRDNEGRAVIAGELYRPGQRVGTSGYTVSAVGKSLVRLKGDDGQELTLELVK